MASVKPQKNGKYVAYIYVGKDDEGEPIKTTRRFEANGLIEARRIAQDIEDQLRFEHENVNSNPTFLKFYDTWLKNFAQKELNAGTREKYRYIDDHVKNFFKQKRIRDIVPLDIVEFFNHETEEGRASLEHKHRLLSSIFRQAIIWGVLEEDKNPIQNIPVPKPVFEARTDYFRPNELKTVLELIDGINLQWHKLAYRIAIMGGLRRGEILGLTEDMIDYERSGVQVHYSLQHTKEEGLVLGKTKAENIRFVTLPEFLMTDIKKMIRNNKYKKLRLGNLYKEFYDYRGKKVLMLFSDELGEPFRPNSLTQSWRKFNDKHSDVIRRLRLHDLRHSSVTYLLSNGFNMKDIQVRLGHSDIKTTLNRYSHVSEEDQIDAAKAFDDFDHNVY